MGKYSPLQQSEYHATPIFSNSLGCCTISRKMFHPIYTAKLQI